MFEIEKYVRNKKLNPDEQEMKKNAKIQVGHRLTKENTHKVFQYRHSELEALEILEKVCKAVSRGFRSGGGNSVAGGSSIFKPANEKKDDCDRLVEEHEESLTHYLRHELLKEDDEHGEEEGENRSGKFVKSLRIGDGCGDELDESKDRRHAAVHDDRVNNNDNDEKSGEL